MLSIGNIFLILWLCTRGSLQPEQVLNLPSLVGLVLCSPRGIRVQLVSDFSQREFVHESLSNFHVYGARKVQGFLLGHLARVTPLPFLTTVGYGSQGFLFKYGFVNRF